VLLLLVFAVKAALVPLHFWLPASYAEAPGPVAALFAIMTKVGAYAIIRIYTLIFPPDLPLTEGLHGIWLLPLALVSVAVGMIGVLAARRLDRLAAFSVIGSMGMVMTAIALMTPAGIEAALYYIAHSTFATAALFLIVDIVRDRRGGHGVRVERAPPIAGGALIAGLFFAAAIAMAGLPPLSGFLGKLLILDAGFESPMMGWIWSVVLASSLVAVLGFARAGSTVFWKSREAGGVTNAGGTGDASEAGVDGDPVARTPALPVVAAGGCIAVLVALTVFAGPMTGYLRATTAQLMTPQPYISSVMTAEGKPIPDKEKDYGKDPGGDDDGAAPDGLVGTEGAEGGDR